MSERHRALENLPLRTAASLTGGADLWSTAAVSHETLRIPSVKMTDGPNGARGELFGGATTACFPCSAALAATFDPELVAEVARAIASQAKAKGYGVLLAPTVNIQRSPLGGRNFECFSEDPWLTASMAVAYVRGAQAEGVACCVKHLVCNDCETERATYSSVVDKRTLFEVYLLPFEAAVVGAGVRAVMAAYNRLNGVYCSEHRWLLTSVLRERWGFEGITISDWGAVHDGVAAARAGLDLEMPGPPRHMGERLAEEVDRGRIDSLTVLRSARRVAGLAEGAAQAGVSGTANESAPDLPEHRRLARRAAARSMVLLKNDSLLPLEPSKLFRVAVLGPFASVPAIQGGGSAKVRPHRVSSPLEALQEWLAPAVEVVHVPWEMPPPLLASADPGWFEAIDDHGNRFSVEYYNGDPFDGGLSEQAAPVATARVRQVSTAWAGGPPGAPADSAFSVRWTGTLVPPRSGRYVVGISASGRSRVLLDGRVVANNWDSPLPGGGLFGVASRERRARLHLEANRRYQVVVEVSHDPREHRWVPGGFGLLAVNFGIREDTPPRGLASSVEAAASADLAVVIVGRGDEYESEGFDRADTELPGSQDGLVEAVASVARATLVVLDCGSAPAMPWIDDVDAVLLALYPGQEFGNALVDVLSGAVAAGGKLPFTIYRRLEDCPAYPWHVPESGSVYYSERVLVGYRGLEARRVEPLFPFGHGLSYGSLVVESVRLLGPFAQPQEPRSASRTIFGPPLACVEVDVSNPSDLGVSEVVQLYASLPTSSVSRPPKWLIGFQRVDLEPGGKATVSIPVEQRSLAYFDVSSDDFILEPGRYELLVGLSSADTRARLFLELPERPGEFWNGWGREERQILD